MQEHPLLTPSHYQCSSPFRATAFPFIHTELHFHRSSSGGLWAAAAEMGSTGIDDSSQKAIEPELIEVGTKLLRHPSSTDELLMLLDRAESLLAKVWQQPPRSTCKALFKTMKALITDELLHSDDLNVQMAVASCCNELTRITAPEFPYEDDTMRVIFQLFMIAFEQLSCESGRNYYRALHIVETIAMVRSCLMILDVDTEGLVVKMFRLFLSNIRSDHPSGVFTYMEMIMTMVIEESDEISVNLLRPLLASVKMKTKDASPISWELGKKVFENCATKLQSYLRGAAKAMNLEFDDFDEIVACICHDTFHGNNMVTKEGSPFAAGVASQMEGLSKTMHGNYSKLHNGILLETVKDSRQIVQSEADKGAPRKRRKPNSAIRSEKYEHTLGTRDKYSYEGSPSHIEDLALMSELENSSMLTNSSQKKNDSLSEVSLPKNGQLTNKKNMVNQDKDLDFSSLKSKILKLKERGYDASKKTGKKGIAGSAKGKVEKEGRVIGDTSKEEKYQLSSQELSAGKVIISHKYVQKNAARKMDGLHMSKPVKANSEKEKNTSIQKKSRRPRAGFGQEIVNLRIQVWWPMDEMFYAGTIEGFDPETKKHKILYDDGEVENLNLMKERWKLSRNEHPLPKQEVDHASPSKELIKTKEKNSKRKAGLLKKQQQNAASSSKRSKGENNNLSKSEDNSSPGFRKVVESDNETCETNVLAKDDVENGVAKEESEILIKKTESNDAQEDERNGKL